MAFLGDMFGPNSSAEVIKDLDQSGSMGERARRMQGQIDALTQQAKSLIRKGSAGRDRAKRILARRTSVQKKLDQLEAQQGNVFAIKQLLDDLKWARNMMCTASEARAALARPLFEQPDDAELEAERRRRRRVGGGELLRVRLPPRLPLRGPGGQRGEQRAEPGGHPRHRGPGGQRGEQRAEPGGHPRHRGPGGQRGEQRAEPGGHPRHRGPGGQRGEQRAEPGGHPRHQRGGPRGAARGGAEGRGGRGPRRLRRPRSPVSSPAFDEAHLPLPAAGPGLCAVGAPSMPAAL
eukprot:TRINITY_DN1121_c0_g1_i1.p2 TRINITY_DN1121_c0_g1~~TRINITY_DN1121_c0_g1_i1.p2  ORF type:complete len:323 (+),score=40.61 TRINITY_DN1121_c0_g1_i1:99-971(+)